jgi:ubiquinol oxidase
VLHLYETFRWFREKEYIKLHFAETWNELHHLLIMEELGGSDRFTDRFVAQHIAFFYYWLVVTIYLINPAAAYNLNKNVESHAFNTYDEFLTKNEEELKKLPVPRVAVEYYEKGNMELFDAFHNKAFEFAMFREKLSSQLSSTSGENSKDGSDSTWKRRRPVLKNLYDVFVNIRDDEKEHVDTMDNLQRDVSKRIRSTEK